MEHCLTHFVFTQLQPLLYKFRCRHLQQHLHYVIENAESKMSVGTPSPKSQGKQHPTKDIRSSLYARIGVTKDRDNSTVLPQWLIFLSQFLSNHMLQFTSLFSVLCVQMKEAAVKKRKPKKMWPTGTTGFSIVSWSLFLSLLHSCISTLNRKGYNDTLQKSNL